MAFQAARAQQPAEGSAEVERQKLEILQPVPALRYHNFTESANTIITLTHKGFGEHALHW